MFFFLSYNFDLYYDRTVDTKTVRDRRGEWDRDWTMSRDLNLG